MFKIDVSVEGLEQLQKHLELVQMMQNLKSDTNFKAYIENKVLQVLEEVMNERISSSKTTNADSIDLYYASNHIQSTEDGFILYNDATIDVSDKLADNYPNGEFSIALAFEYGTGITGEGVYNGDYFTPWAYNVNNYNFGWSYTDENGERQSTYGYEGFEIYRYTAERINKEYFSWCMDYIRNEE